MNLFKNLEGLPQFLGFLARHPSGKLSNSLFAVFHNAKLLIDSLQYKGCLGHSGLGSRSS